MVALVNTKSIRRKQEGKLYLTWEHGHLQYDFCLDNQLIDPSFEKNYLIGRRNFRLVQVMRSLDLSLTLQLPHLRRSSAIKQTKQVT